VTHDGTSRRHRSQVTTKVLREDGVGNMENKGRRDSDSDKLVAK
jgi:hypothetical protein